MGRMGILDSIQNDIHVIKTEAGKRFPKCREAGERADRCANDFSSLHLDCPWPGSLVIYNWRFQDAHTPPFHSLAEPCIKSKSGPMCCLLH